MSVDRIWLEVRPSNSAARALYRGAGFIEEGRRPGYYNDTGEDALLMSLYLVSGMGCGESWKDAGAVALRPGWESVPAEH